MCIRDRNTPRRTCYISWALHYLPSIRSTRLFLDCMADLFSSTRKEFLSFLEGSPISGRFIFLNPKPKSLPTRNGLRFALAIFRSSIRLRFQPVRACLLYTHLRAHETRHDLVCRLLLEKKKRK